MNINLEVNKPVIVEMIDTSYGWKSMLFESSPFLITVIIVLSAATVTYRSNRKSVESQNNIADQSRKEEHENRIAEFRHKWLQEVRETGAHLCRVIHELQYNAERRKLAVEYKNKSEEDSDEKSVDEYQSMIDDSGSIINQSRSEFYALSAKMKLLFKEDEESTKDAFKILDDIRGLIYDLESMTLKESQIDSLIKELQRVLKSEWEITKRRSENGA